MTLLAILRRGIAIPAKAALRAAGYDVVRTADVSLQQQKHSSDMMQDQGFMAIHELCRDFTCTNMARMYVLYRAVDFIVAADIPGDIVECGVWRGGSAMLCAHALIERSSMERKIWLYDTFEGMSAPSDHDRDWQGQGVRRHWEELERPDGGSDWDYAPFENVQNSMAETGYPDEKTVFVKGKVEDTIPDTAPERIALLRLDTDWYESTYHELVHLFPRVSRGGVIIIDDYGYWKGQKQAVDRYFREQGISLLLNRVDYGMRVGVKL